MVPCLLSPLQAGLVDMPLQTGLVEHIISHVDEIFPGPAPGVTQKGRTPVAMLSNLPAPASSPLRQAESPTDQRSPVSRAETELPAAAGTLV